MAGDTITCPNCEAAIPLTEALSREINAGFKKEYEARYREREKEYKRREEELQRKNREIDKRVADRLATERTRLELQARKRAEAASAIKISALEEETRENKKLLAEANAKELAYLKEKSAFEDARRDFELEKARAMEKERAAIRENAEKAFIERHRLKDLEKDKMIQDMKGIITELKRKSEQGSMQTQGEVMELDLEAALKARFPFDEILPVPKGIRGADIIQKVKTSTGHYCGTIIWELKRTKAWKDEWLIKLKDDQREVKADIAVIATEALPKETSSFDLIEGVWVTEYHLAKNLAYVLRESLVNSARIIQSAVGKEEKMEAIYKYLSGSEFSQKVRAVLETTNILKVELNKEKAAMNRLWAKRDKQIDKIFITTAGMYGDLEGIIGAALPPIKTLELDEGANEAEKPSLPSLAEGSDEKEEGLF